MVRSNYIFPIILFAILSFMIVYPLLSPGYLLTLDMVFPPKIGMPEFTSSAFLYQSLLFLLNSFIPIYWLQKIILFLIFFLSGWLMYLFVPAENWSARIFAGLFYAVNPFVYERVMAGHWPFLLAYAVFPWAADMIVNFFRDPKKSSAFLLAVITTVITSLALHYLVIEAFFFVVYIITLTFFDQQKLRRTGRTMILFFGFSLLFNFNWLLPFLFGRSSLAAAITNFGPTDLSVFRSIADERWGLVFNLLSGYGFWAETHHYFILAKEIIFFWPVLSITIIGISLYGFYQSLKNSSSLVITITLGVLFILSLDLAGGVALKHFSKIILALYDKVIILRGFREPQKLIALVVLFYAYCGGIGLSALIKTVKKQSKNIILSSFLVIPFLYTPTVFGGFWGQLKPTFYPDSWNEVNEVLKKDSDKFITIFFPWHQYMKFNFANNLIIANPAPGFFEKPVISSQNPETIPNYTPDQRPEALHVEGLLTIEEEGVNLFGEPVSSSLSWGELLAPIGVKYVILAKDDDWQKYGFLDDSPDLEKVYETEEIILYKNLGWYSEETFE